MHFVNIFTKINEREKGENCEIIFLILTLWPELPTPWYRFTRITIAWYIALSPLCPLGSLGAGQNSQYTELGH